MIRKLAASAVLLLGLAAPVLAQPAIQVTAPLGHHGGFISVGTGGAYPAYPAAYPVAYPAAYPVYPQPAVAAYVQPVPVYNYAYYHHRHYVPHAVPYHHGYYRR